MENTQPELRKITLPVPEKPWYFWHITEAPPKNICLIDLAMNHEAFLVTGKDTGNEYIIERLDFFVFKNGEPIPSYILCMALDMDEDTARKYVKAQYAGKPIAIFFFRIKERL